jgi:prepilin-type N-terminal cleavage/methylation domain-containing protein
MKSGRGFSLMEVLVAMVLLGAVGAATMHAFSSSVGVVAQNDAGVAYNVARGRLEQFLEYVRQDQWSTAALPLSRQTAPARPAIPNKVLNGDTFVTTYAVNNDSDQPIDQNADGVEDYRRVTMTVTW